MPLTRARYRIYGGPANYGRALRDLLLGAHRTDLEVPALEGVLAAQLGAPHAVVTALARVALHDLVRHFVPPGRALLLSPYTIVDVVNAVVDAGARPVFVDVDPRTGNLDPDALAGVLASGTANDASAVLVTHLHGVSADIEGILQVARGAGLPVIEDAAQAMGARIGERRVGTLGEAGVYSFGSYKNINAHFGGVVVSPDAGVAAAIRAARDARPIFPARHLLRKLRASLVTDLFACHPTWGALLFPFFRTAFLRDWEPVNRALRIELDTVLRPLPPYMFGRFTDLQARAARAQLPDLDTHARWRISVAARYHAGLDGHPDLVLPPAPVDLRNVYTYYAVQVRGAASEVRARRHDLLRVLAAAGRDVPAQHLHDVSALPDFARFGARCPQASRVAGAVLLLPTYPGYDDAQSDANLAVLRAWRA